MNNKTCQECAYYNYYLGYCEHLAERILPDEDIYGNFEG